MDKAQRVKEAAEAVFTELGYGHSEKVYHNSLEVELSHAGIPFSSEGSVPIYYRGKSVGYRKPDMFVGDDENDVTIVELKAKADVGENQLRSYITLGGNDANITIQKAILVNFTPDGVDTFIWPDDDESEEDSSDEQDGRVSKGH